MSGSFPGSRRVLVIGVTLLLVIVMACAQAKEEAAPAPTPPTASAPTATAAPTQAQAPVAAPAPAQAPTLAPTPATTPAAAPSAALRDGEPLVPGGPPFYAAKLAQFPGWQILQRWHYTKLPLWTRASYGGEMRGMQTISPAAFRILKVLSLNRPTQAGMLLYTDSGRCSLIGREDFSRCQGQYARNESYAIVPGIFQRWEQPDAVTYVFNVRKGVLWPAIPPMARTDREVTADDIAFFLQTTKREGITAQNFALVKQFEAVDRYTVKITLVSPNADFLLNLAHTSQGIFPKECYETKDCLDEVKSKSPGPFLVREYRVREKLAFEKNQEFYLKGLPYIDRLTLFHVIDPTAQRAGFLTSQSDFYSVSTVPQAEDTLKRIPGAQLHASGGVGAVTGNIRPQYKGPLADSRVRRALAMTIDHVAMWNASFDGHGMLTPLVSRHYFGDGFYLTIEQAGDNYTFNPTKAKQLMAEAGYPNGFETRINLTTGLVGYQYNQALWMQSQWKKYLNVELKFNEIDFLLNTNLYLEGSWQGFYNAQCCWIPSCWGTADDCFAQFVKGSPQNVQKIDDEKIEEFHRKQRGELDPAKRAKILWEFDEYERQQVYQIRTGYCSFLTMMQPWEMNGANHDTMYFTGFNGPTWLGMHDTSKYASGRR